MDPKEAVVIWKRQHRWQRVWSAAAVLAVVVGAIVMMVFVYQMGMAGIRELMKAVNDGRLP